MKAIFTPIGYVYQNRPAEFPSIMRGQPSLSIRFPDWSLTGWEL